MNGLLSRPGKSCQAQGPDLKLRVGARLFVRERRAASAVSKGDLLTKKGTLGVKRFLQAGTRITVHATGE